MHAQISSTATSAKGQSMHPGNLRMFETGDSTLKAVELSLFSYQLPFTGYESFLKEVCGTAFRYEIKSVSEEGVMTVLIAPHDFCLVEGGMLYKSAGSIISSLIENGFLIHAMATVVE